MNSSSFISYTEKDLERLPPRPERSHKGTFGRVACLCGSCGMAGAAYLAAYAAYRTGAGLVEIITPESSRTILQTLLPEAIVTTYDDEDPDLRTITASVARADALVIGCGLGTSAASACVLETALTYATAPAVVDADALNLIAKRPHLRPLLCGKIITPHVGEASRLFRIPTEELLSDISAYAARFANHLDCVCVLKDHHTIVAAPNQPLYKNTSGNSGMATGGSGDVLAGIIGGLLAQQKNLAAPDPYLAATLGVYIHGLCGDCAAACLSEYSVMASDLIEALPEILRKANI